MKKWHVIFVCWLVFVLGSALGYYAGMWRGSHGAFTGDWNNYEERDQENAEFEARAYLRCLQAIDSGNITNLHDHALAALRFYVWDVQQSREKGYTWAPHIQWLYSNATVYVAEHPRKEGEKTHRPDNAREPTATAP